MNTFNKEALELIQSGLETINQKISGTQSIGSLVDLGGVLASWMAFSGEQVALAKRAWRKEQAIATQAAARLTDSAGHQVKSTTIINKHAEGLAGDAEADHTFADRINKSCTHTLNFLQTAISALKEEYKAFTQKT